MNIILLFSVFVIFATRVDNFKIHNEDNTQKVLLRKLQNFKQNETSTVTWNEILADVLVTKITRSEVNTDSNNGNILRKCFSEVLWLFKTYVYDKFWVPRFHSEVTTETYSNAPTTDPTIDDKGLIPPLVLNTTPISTNSDAVYNPKSEVELIEPRYHGKIEEIATTSTETPKSETETELPKVKKDTTDLSNLKPAIDAKETSKNCPEGSEKDDYGNCVDSKTSKFILFVPKQCPIGYRLDRLGFCRELW